MTRAKIISELKKYFELRELVCDHTYRRFGSKAWQFFDTPTLQTLLVIRTKIIRSPLICNTETSQQRGLRCNLCTIVKTATYNNKHYLSAHVMGKAFDLISKEHSAAEMRKMIAEKQDLLPVPIRMESGVSWLHFDTYQVGDNKITFFE